MADALFDTSLFVDYVRGDEKAQELFAKVVSGEMTASYSPVTIAELWQGEMSGRQEIIQYEALLTAMGEVSLTSRIAKIAGGGLREVTGKRRIKLFADALIAATAKDRGEVIYTRNIKDMKLFYNEVEGY